MGEPLQRYEAFCARLLRLVAIHLEKDAVQGDGDMDETIHEINALHHDFKHGTIIPGSRYGKQEEKFMSVETLTIALGGTVLLESARRHLPRPYMHWCANCREVFNSEDGKPPKCRRCGAKHWSNPYRHDAPQMGDSPPS